MARLDRRAFPEHVDFITSPGHRARGGLRRDLGMPGAGPVRVITDRGTLAANGDTGELELEALFPGASIDDVRSSVGWHLAVRDSLAPIDPPSAEELRLLRDVVDPKRRFLRA
jgi:glutaconate CoA-transferase subunit B